MQTTPFPPDPSVRRGRRPLALMLALLALVSLLAASCGGSSKSSSKNSSGSFESSGATGARAVNGTINGGGSSFQDTFEQKAKADFEAANAKAGGKASVQYTKTGSSDGKKQLAARTLDFAGSDSPLKPEEKAVFANRKILYFPIVGGPIAIAYKLKGVTDLQLSPDTVAKIFSGASTRWSDPAIKADNPKAKLPDTPIAVVHRSDGSGTTSNFTKFLVAAAPTSWTLGSGETVQWTAGQGAEKSTGVTSVIRQTDGAIGYADLADAAKENLDAAAVKNAAGKFVKPTPDSAKEALAAATLGPDLTYNPLNAKGDKAYPITSPTWILVDAQQSDPAKAAVIKAYLTYILGKGQAPAKSLLYAPLPENIRKAATDQITQIGG